MAKSEKVTLTNMCMIEDSLGNVLVQDKKSSTWGGICFPGGHVEEKESFTTSVIREIREETGLHISSPVLCGIKQFCSAEGGERYIVFLYKADKFSGSLKSSDEGEVFWMPKCDVLKSKIAPNFEDMFKVFEDDGISEVYYTRENGELTTEFY
ncbi:MAG: 8-oxo-dGTP diphosphatase [Clostridia bacterium]|nr:8-oxo-dGTP diphosphatase [Clostridia bacterium]